MTSRLYRWLALLAAVLLLAAACSSDGDGDAADDTTTTAEAEDDAGDEEADGEEGADGPTMTVTPDTGITSGQTVIIEASGFTPGLTLGITQCAAEADPDNEIGDGETESGDCDLAGIAAVEVDDDGNAVDPDTGSTMLEYSVNTGPFGENMRVCDADHDDTLAVGELVDAPDAERATADIMCA